MVNNNIFQATLMMSSRINFERNKEYKEKITILGLTIDKYYRPDITSSHNLIIIGENYNITIDENGNLYKPKWSTLYSYYITIIADCKYSNFLNNCLTITID
jgi:hypothetical protein